MEGGVDYYADSYFLGVSGILGMLTTFSFEGVNTFWGVDFVGELLKILSTGLSLESF